jgi:hypothetical protein
LVSGLLRVGHSMATSPRYRRRTRDTPASDITGLASEEESSHSRWRALSSIIRLASLWVMRFFSSGGRVPVLLIFAKLFFSASFVLTIAQRACLVQVYPVRFKCPLRFVYHIASFFTSQAHSSISASSGKFLRIFMCRELRSQLAPVYKSSIWFGSLMWRTALLLSSIFY